MAEKYASLVTNSLERPKELTESVVDSLKKKHKDYCFSLQQHKIIIGLCKKDFVNVIYKKYYDRYENLDYIEYIPVKFIRTPFFGCESLQINKNEIDEDINAWEFEDLSKFTEKYVKRNTKLTKKTQK